MNNELAISFKITNWCNLNCAHCCEYSGPKHKTNFMPLMQLNKYLAESKNMDIRPNQLLTFGGGEALAPYMFQDFHYIPFALELTYSYGYIPTIKTNGTWGDNDELRIKILSDIAACAYKYGKLITLDISVDEFHNNQNGVMKIIQNTLTNNDLCYAIRICLVGFNTTASRVALQSLQQKLQATGFQIETTHAGDWMISAPNSDFGIYMYNDFTTPIFNTGRALENKVYTSTDDPNGDNRTNCLQLDNDGIATLNYKYREPINNRPLNTVLKSLLEKTK